MIDVAVYGLLPPSLPSSAASPSAPFFNALCRCLAPAASASAAAASATARHESQAQLLRARGLVDVACVLQSMVEKGSLSLPAGSKHGLPAFHRPRLCAPHALSALGDGGSLAPPYPSLTERLPPLDELAAGTAPAPARPPATAAANGAPSGAGAGGAGSEAGAAGGSESVELVPADAPMRLFIAYRLRGEQRRLLLEDDEPLAIGVAAAS